MKMKLFLMMLSVAFLSPIFGQRTITLDEGTVVQVVLDENLTSNVSQVGDLVNLSIAEDVIVDNKIVLKKGSLVTGRVTEASAAKWAGQKGKLDFTIDYAKSEFGKNINLAANNAAAGKSRMGGVIAAAAVINPLLVLIKGKEITVPKGKIFTTYVAKEYALDTRKHTEPN